MRNKKISFACPNPPTSNHLLRPPVLKGGERLISKPVDIQQEDNVFCLLHLIVFSLDCSPLNTIIFQFMGRKFKTFRCNIYGHLPC